MKKFRVVLTGLTFLFILSALLGCTPAPAPTPQVVEKVVEITKIVKGETVVITATPMPPTPTVVPLPVVKVASNVSLPLRIYKEGNVIKGFEYDVYKQALNRAGYDVQVVDVAFAGIFAGLQSEKWDMACSSIYITKEREDQMDFTEPLAEGFEAAVAPVDGEVKTLADFKGKVIGTETGTSQAAWLASMQKEYGPFQIRGYEERETQYLDLEAGRIQALTTGYNTAVIYLKDKPKYHIIATSKNNFMIGCAVRKDDALKEKFNKALQEMKKDGTTEKLYVQYFGQKPPADSAVTRIFTEPYVPNK